MPVEAIQTIKPNDTDILLTAHLKPVPGVQPVKDVMDPEEADINTDEKSVEPQEDQKQEIDKPDFDEKEEKSTKFDDHDEYGNEKPKKSSKTYTEDEVNERINKAVRDRIERFEKNNGVQQQPQPSPQQVQQAKDNGLTYDPNSEQDWQQQLKSFIRQTQEETQREQVMRSQQAREQQAQAEFESKFHQGMGRFSDFRDVVGSQPITDAMTYATRAMTDPAAFLYAASKRHPAELERISRIQDSTVQMVEMGRLEERMKKSAASTKAPKPIDRVYEDATIAEPKKRETSFEDTLAMNDANRMSKMRKRR